MIKYLSLSGDQLDESYGALASRPPIVAEMDIGKQHMCICILNIVI